MDSKDLAVVTVLLSLIVALKVVVAPILAEPARIEERPYSGTETRVFAPLVL